VNRDDEDRHFSWKDEDVEIVVPAGEQPGKDEQ